MSDTEKSVGSDSPAATSAGLRLSARSTRNIPSARR